MNEHFIGEVGEDCLRPPPCGEASSAAAKKMRENSRVGVFLLVTFLWTAKKSDTGAQGQKSPAILKSYTM